MTETGELVSPMVPHHGARACNSQAQTTGEKRPAGPHCSSEHLKFQADFKHARQLVLEAFHKHSLLCSPVRHQCCRKKKTFRESCDVPGLGDSSENRLSVSAPEELSHLSRGRDNYVNKQARKKNVQHARRIMKKILSREVGQRTCQGGCHFT